MEHYPPDTAELVEALRYVDDLELQIEDVVGCAANASDTMQVFWPT